MIVTIKELVAIRKRINEINSVPLSELKVFKDGVLIKFTKEEYEDLRFVGLTNEFILRQFIESDDEGTSKTESVPGPDHCSNQGDGGSTAHQHLEDYACQ